VGGSAWWRKKGKRERVERCQRRGGTDSFSDTERPFTSSSHSRHRIPALPPPPSWGLCPLRLLGLHHPRHRPPSSLLPFLTPPRDIRGREGAEPPVPSKGSDEAGRGGKWRG
jgi:hypothetical protein